MAASDLVRRLGETLRYQWWYLGNESAFFRVNSALLAHMATELEAEVLVSRKLLSSRFSNSAVGWILRWCLCSPAPHMFLPAWLRDYHLLQGSLLESWDK